MGGCLLGETWEQTVHRAQQAIPGGAAGVLGKRGAANRAGLEGLCPPRKSIVTAADKQPALTLWCREMHSLCIHVTFEGAPPRIFVADPWA